MKKALLAAVFPFFLSSCAISSLDNVWIPRDPEQEKLQAEQEEKARLDAVVRKLQYIYVPRCKAIGVTNTDELTECAITLYEEDLAKQSREVAAAEAIDRASRRAAAIQILQDTSNSIRQSTPRTTRCDYTATGMNCTER